MREEQGSQASTVRRRLAALSSLFAHLVKFDVVEMNPVRDVERPAVNRREGMPLAFSQKHTQAAQRINDYLTLAEHGDDIEEPLFRPVRGNRKGWTHAGICIQMSLTVCSGSMHGTSG